MDDKIREFNDRLTKLEEKCQLIDTKFTSIMSVMETKLKLLNTSSMIEFKAITTEALSSIGEDIGKIEKDIKDIKSDFIVLKDTDIQKLKESVVSLKVKMFIYAAIGVFILNQIFSLIFYFVKLKL